MELTIRRDSNEKCLRSVGEPPGIIAMIIHDGTPSFAVDPGFQPTPGLEGAVIQRHPGQDPAANGVTAVDVADVVDGCTDAEALASLLGIAINSAQVSIYEIGMRAGRWPAVHAQVDLLERTVELVNARATVIGEDPPGGGA